jgi:hypothetical protein
VIQTIPRCFAAALLAATLTDAATATGSPDTGEDAPELTAQHPPAPASLDPAPASSSATGRDRAALSAALPGLEPLLEGGWRLRLHPGATTVPPSAVPVLGELGRRLAAEPRGRVQVLAQSSGPAEDVSTARRLALERGIAVKQALSAGGLPETRIDIRPIGRTQEALDVVDVRPPSLTPSTR